MSAVNVLNAHRERFALAWLARTEQERKYIAAGAVALAAALVYLVFIGPALEGRADLRKNIPALRQDAATMQALAQEAAQFGNQGALQVTPVTQASLTASLAANGITAAPGALVVVGENAKLDLSNVPFANLTAWLDAQRREHRLAVQEATVVALAAPGMVDATLALRQNNGSGAQ
ncbi:type II secretion system protein GspM [Massilia glaciei]|uniref:Type II secretion system protein M n=1 Tax=Massilia glaciei TaxID=1524097 RepID=A0A2U2I511_9BURK|nr:type II secretion system protein GspM [Massilia glaciei]PWF54817.1 type II secretion system protein M [Massilia glaciei]